MVRCTAKERKQGRRPFGEDAARGRQVAAARSENLLATLAGLRQNQSRRPAGRWLRRKRSLRERSHMSAVIRILIGGIAGAILGYLMHVGTFAGLGLGLFVVLWFTQRN